MQRAVPTEEKQRADDYAGAQLGARWPQPLPETPQQQNRTSDEVAESRSVQRRNGLDGIPDGQIRGAPDDVNCKEGQGYLNAQRPAPALRRKSGRGSRSDCGSAITHEKRAPRGRLESLLACNELYLLCSLHENSAPCVTSQARPSRCHDLYFAGLSQRGIRQPVFLARFRQQPGARRFRPPDRPSSQSLLARRLLASFPPCQVAPTFYSTPRACRSS